MPSNAHRGGRKDPTRFIGEILITYRDVYVGELSASPDPLDWGGDWNGNTPRDRGPWFPAVARSDDPFDLLIRKIETGELPGKKVDWGAWAACVTKAQILAFIAEAYTHDHELANGTAMPHLAQQMRSLLTYVQALCDEKTYALVAEEL